MKAYTLKIRGGVTLDSHGKQAGKGALIQEELSGTLGVSQDQYLFQPIGVDSYNLTTTGNVGRCLSTSGGDLNEHIPCVIAFEPGTLEREGGHIYENKSGAIRAKPGDNQMTVAYSIENHPNDSRVQFSKDGKVQALTSRMGTGGGNVPMILQSKGCYWDGSQVCGTLTAHNANGAQRMPDKENFTCVIQHKGGVYPTKAGSLMASGYNKLGTQEAMNDLYVVIKK